MKTWEQKLVTADIKFDHNMLCTDIRVKLKRIAGPKKGTNNFNKLDKSKMEI